MSTDTWWIIGGVIAFLIIIGLRVINQYERGVILTLGRFTGSRGPGLTWVLPIFQRLLRADVRLSTVDIPKQEVITKDNVPVQINAVVYFQVKNAEQALLQVQDFAFAVTQYGQAALRDVIGRVELDTLLAEREHVADEMKKIVDETTESWGVSVQTISMQDIELPADMKRIMAKQAESERERRAVIIRSEGELAAAQKLAEAAKTLSEVPGGLSIRTLATIEKIQPDPSKTVIFALPVEVMEGLQSMNKLFGDRKS